MSISGMELSCSEPHGGKPLTVTVAMARKISGLGNTTIWALIKSGKLEAVRVRRRRLIVYRSLERLLSPALPDPSSQPRRRGRPPKVTTA
jgi:excisionase family DNA binding protein